MLLHACVACGVQRLVAIESDSIKVLKGERSYIPLTYQSLKMASSQVPLHSLQWIKKSVCEVSAGQQAYVKNYNCHIWLLSHAAWFPFSNNPLVYILEGMVCPR